MTGGAGHQRPRRARHQRLPVPAAAGPAVDDPGLRPRADDRAADRRAAGVDRLAHRRVSATSPTSSTTPCPPPTTASLGRYDAIAKCSVRGAHEERPSSFAASRPFPPSSRSGGTRFSLLGRHDRRSTRFRGVPQAHHAGRVAYAAGFTGLGVGATVRRGDTRPPVGPGHRAHPAGDGAPDAPVPRRPRSSPTCRHRAHPLVAWIDHRRGRPVPPTRRDRAQGSAITARFAPLQHHDWPSRGGGLTPPRGAVGAADVTAPALGPRPSGRRPRRPWSPR